MRRHISATPPTLSLARLSLGPRVLSSGAPGRTETPQSVPKAAVAISCYLRCKGRASLRGQGFMQCCSSESLNEGVEAGTAFCHVHVLRDPLGVCCLCSALRQILQTIQFTADSRVIFRQTVCFLGAPFTVMSCNALALALGLAFMHAAKQQFRARQEQLQVERTRERA